MRTQVGIIGAGPAGLVLARLLQQRGIDSIVIEARSREYVEKRLRAGVLEHATVDLMRQMGVGQRMDREGLTHEGTELRFDGEGHRIDFTALTGKSIMVYGQQEVVKDLIAQRTADDLPLHFEVSDVSLDPIEPSIEIVHSNGVQQRIECDYIAGCDGFHGISKTAIPSGHLTAYDRVYPFSWLGILAEAEPVSPELIYAHSERGFALLSQRSPSVVRAYLQVPNDTVVNDWPDERIWDELDARTWLRDESVAINRGPMIDKSVTAMRSWVTEPMRYERLFLAGDAAHIVPPTGAKGMNLAIADVAVLATAIEKAYQGSKEALDAYSDTALRRVWRAQHFSWWMTSMLHRFGPDQTEGDAYGLQLQLSQLRYVTSSESAARSLAENYVGLDLSAG